MVLRLPFAHVPSHFAEDGHGRHDLNTVNLGQVDTCHAKQQRSHIEPGGILCGLFPKPTLPHLRRQIGIRMPMREITSKRLESAALDERLFCAAEEIL